MEHTAGEFFRAVLPDSGVVCVGRLGQAKGSIFNHDKYNNVDEMLAALENADYTKENYYFAVSSFDKFEGILDRGKIRFRAQANAKLTRCIILDIDIKAREDYYTSKDEAWEGIQKLCFQLNLPQPIVVDSGFGYHVYWPMLAGVPSKDWQGVAKLFYQAASIVEPKAVADSSRVSDSASVLRIPGSFNLKHGQQTPVQIVQWYDNLLDFGDFKDTLQRIVGKRATNGNSLTSALVVEQEFEKAQLVPLIKNCNWIASYLKNIKTTSEPEWYAMLGLAPFVEHTKDGNTLNGYDIAKAFSKGHPSYDEDATIAKYNQAKASQTGPTTCAKFQQIDSSRCEGCPFKGAVKSPSSASRLAKPATQEQTKITTAVDDEGNKQQVTVTIPLPPTPYFRGESGGVYTRVREKVGEDEWQEKIVKVYDYDIYPVKRFRSELIEEEQVEVHLWLPKDGMRRFKMPTETLVEHKKLGAFLASRGAIGEQGSSVRMSKYMIDYVRHMQTEQVAEVEYSRFGWRGINSADPKFVVGNGIVDKDGTVHPAAFPSFLQQAATAVAAYGDLNKWKTAFGVYNQFPNSEPYIFTAMMGFAAPLMALTPYAGVLVNMVGESGAGKSAALAVMTSVWGQPNPNRIRVTDTQIAMYNTIGYLSAVPVAFDEVTTMDAQAASEFALNFTGGRGKDRAGRDGQNKDNHVTWDTIVVGSSNTSMYAKFTAARKGYNAEAMRLFEYGVPEGREQDKPKMDKAMRELSSNYGLAGRVYIGAVMRNRDKISDAIEKKANQILAQTGGTNAERFWATLIACWYVGATVAKNLNLHEYDINKVMGWVTGQVSVSRESSGKAAADPKALIGEFINQNLSSMIRVKDRKVDLTVNATQPQSIKGRLEFEGDKLVTAVVSAKALTDYCNYSRIDSSWLILELTKLGITDGINRPMRLATGTNFPNPTVRSYIVDMSKQTE